MTETYNEKVFTNDKKDLLFLHGYLSNGKSFAYQRAYFERYFNVYTPDLTGFGENAYMPYPYRLDDYVKEVRDYIKANGLYKPCVIAHSFGGRIALKSAFMYPDAYSKIVLTGCAGLTPRFSVKKQVKRTAFNLIKHFINKEKLTAFYSSDYKSLSPVMKESFIKIVNERLDYTLKGISVPTLIVWGENDRETPLYMAKRLNDGITDSKLSVIKNAGHFAFIDKPQKFNEEVKEFLL